MNYKYLILLMLNMSCAVAMRVPEKNSSAESTPPRGPLPLISQVLESSKKSASAGNSPRRVSLPAVDQIEKEPKKSSSGGGSPAGPRFSGVRSMGKRDSRELAGALKDEFSKMESAELNARFEKAKKGSKILLQKKEFEQLACAKIKNPVFQDEILKQNAADIVFKANAHEIMIALQNRLTYLNQKNQQEANNQASTSIKLFFEQHDLLLRLSESEDNSHDYSINRWNALRKLAPVFKHLEEHLQKDAPKDVAKLEEYQATIKEEHFLPK